MLPSTLHRELLRPTVKEDMHVKENTKKLPSTQHYVTYPPAKFEIAVSNRLRGDAFTRKYIF